MVTYRELIEELQKNHADHLDDDVTILIPWDDEYFTIDELPLWQASNENDVLDVGTPILRLWATPTKDL